MSTTTIEADVVAAETVPGQPLRTRPGTDGLPSGVVPEGAPATDQTSVEHGENSRIGSEYDHETASLVSELLRSGYTPGALAVVLTVDDDTLRRWRRGVRASHGMRKFMRCVLVLRHLAPGLLATIGVCSIDELVSAVGGLTTVALTPQDMERRAMLAAYRQANRDRMRGWADGSEGGGL